MEPLTFGSLFAGIGGIDLGLERAGMVCKFQVEIDDYATRVLTKHWPDVPRFRDVRECGAHNLPQADLICGGFPCQDISNAGRQAGIDGERSGLWSEYHRIVRELRPRYVLVENVAALLVRGMGRVLGDLAAIGYDCEWQCISASTVGAPHRRDRVFIVAHATSIGFNTGAVFRGANTQKFDSESIRWWSGRSVQGRSGRVFRAPAGDFLRMADGIPDRMERYKGLGNAVVPQVAELIGRWIVEHDVSPRTD